MPREYQMTWEHARKRWAKMYGGKRYTVTPSVLSKKYATTVPETQDGSYQFANQWWKEKRAELDSTGRGSPTRPLLPGEDLFAALIGVPLDLYLNPVCGGSPEEAKALMQSHFSAFLDRLITHGEPIGVSTADSLSPARLQQFQGAIAAIRGEPSGEPDKSVQALSESWLREQQARAEAGQMSPERCANNRTCLEKFKVYLGPQTDAGGINEAKWAGFQQFCLSRIKAGRDKGSGGWSVSYARDVVSVAKGFIKWLSDLRIIDRPRNLDSMRFKGGPASRTVQTWTEKEFKIAVREATGKLQLALLLMANCGMTQEDISELRDHHVDWQEGRIIRKRAKTADHENVPTVNYKLWSPSFALLSKYRSGGERVLLTERGEPYVRCHLREDGKLSKADGFASSYVHLKKKVGRILPGFNRPLKELRKLGVSLLDNHKDYGRFSSYFLGHSPRTVAERHYIKPGQPLFDEAVAWIGYQLGQMP